MISITCEAEYKEKLARLEVIFGSPIGTPESAEEDALVDLIHAYEAIHFPIEAPEPIEMLKFRLENLNLTTDALLPIIGTRQNLEQFLCSQIKLDPTMRMRIHSEFGVPQHILADL